VIEIIVNKEEYFIKNKLMAFTLFKSLKFQRLARQGTK